MLRLITLPFRWVRATRYALIASGALISGLGLWMQINGVPPAGEPVVSGLSGLLVYVMDGPTTVFGVFSKIGGVLALLGLLGMTVHDIAPVNRNTVVIGSGPEIQQTSVDTTPAMLTWQERLAAKTGPQPDERVAKSGVSVIRIGLIGLVICAFLAVLGATVMGTVSGAGDSTGQGQSVAQASSPGHALILAHLAASGAIDNAPAAAPGAAFSIPKFDPATVVPWVKAQLAKALAGDQAAMITLGSVFGGIFVLMLGIKIMFSVRRDRAALRTPTRRPSYS